MPDPQPGSHHPSLPSGASLRPFGANLLPPFGTGLAGSGPGATSRASVVANPLDLTQMDAGSATASRRPVDKKKFQKRAKPWAEKYRPKELRSIVHSAATERTFARMLASPAKTPHLLLHGPPGVGKTTTAWAFLYELFGPIAARKHVKAMNSSQDRGVRVIREEVKTYCRNDVYQEDDEPDKYPSPCLKFVLLDEADALTFEAQAALRRVMEEHSGHARFILCCNYVNKIIEPIQSRCALIRFQPLDDSQHREHLRGICEAENLLVADEGLDVLLALSEGDCRRAITLLQSTCASLVNPASRLSSADASLQLKKKISRNDILRLGNALPDESVEKIVDHILCSQTVEDVEQDAESLLREAYAPAAVVGPLRDALLDRATLTDFQCSKAATLIAEVDGMIGAGTPAECILPYLLVSLFAIARSPKDTDAQEDHAEKHLLYSIGQLQEYPHEEHWGKLYW
ncbi:unnamed protein product [Amoebophrya sp. A25]|nr:unnamed protein product [Amoebophrya sp. A25]|eukprot:GSA25T00013400001.1